MRSPDTDPAAEQVQLRLLREASVAARVSLALSLSRMTMALAWRALREAYPTADNDELAVRFVTQHYGPDLGAGLRRDIEARRSGRRP
jgi:hypothetical protein